MRAKYITLFINIIFFVKNLNAMIYFIFKNPISLLFKNLHFPLGIFFLKFLQIIFYLILKLHKSKNSKILLTILFLPECKVSNNSLLSELFIIH